MRSAQAGVAGPKGAGHTWIDLTYSYYADNTWYYPSVGKIGATSGTWDIDRTTGALYLYSDDELIGWGEGFAMPDYAGYPFNGDFMGRASTMQFYLADAEWSLGRFGWAHILQYCTWYMNKI
jgi:hypothetical protein